MNLLNGADLLPTLLQICYVVAIGFLFVIIFIKSGSLIPCIITHMVINSLTVFGTDGTGLSVYLIPIILIIISVFYAILINKTIKE